MLLEMLEEEFIEDKEEEEEQKESMPSKLVPKPEPSLLKEISTFPRIFLDDDRRNYCTSQTRTEET